MLFALEVSKGAASASAYAAGHDLRNRKLLKQSTISGPLDERNDGFL